MGERLSSQEDQIEFEQKRKQATEFLDIVNKTIIATGKKYDYFGPVTTVLELGKLEIRFEQKNEHDELNSNPDRVVLKRKTHEFEDIGEYATFRVGEEEVLVRDFSVYNDSHPLYNMTTSEMSVVFPDLKDREVPVEVGKNLIDFLRSPVMGSDFIDSFFKPTDSEDVIMLENKRVEQAKMSEENKLTMEKHYDDWMHSNPGFIGDDPLDDPLLDRLI